MPSVVMLMMNQNLTGSPLTMPGEAGRRSTDTFLMSSTTTSPILLPLQERGKNTINLKDRTALIELIQRTDAEKKLLVMK